ncbi:aldehyde oxidase and xanthine dehydrogenase molybdopterin binding protein (plasmid) [Gemmatirosa kalamazoonensis]|uniref:Aldehyde oxidase and xanthine dehydrogenase molybdopterin binding protein n=1 Tax=Gemmatirosa kalamazoonensis TaxID=861299 RepID=W0RTQ3_9BACT|nr:molybdopterin cofactor-binding domain-containing protein [Gemmatirosa kalamazoonensis]AHG93837.1 aldehyde oxidase and xanthine dehydrogenase molybdopterin binding protein [Gemmatirosa kalamazoonensis]
MSVPDADARSAITRRDFVTIGTTVLGGLLVGVRAAPDALAPNAFVRLEPDGAVVIVVARPEMGQGVRTTLAMLVAEELDAPWERVRVEQGDLDPSRYGEQYTGGSAVVRTSWEPLRRAGAAARALLVGAAAARWGVPVAECTTEPGEVVHAATGRRAAYATLLDDARRGTPPAEPPLKEPGAYRIIGRPTRGVDVPDIVTGRARYGVDVRVPGMLFASVERSPVFGGRLAAVDDRAARASRGVVAVVRIDADAMPAFAPNSPKPPNGVAVVADGTWHATEGRRALRLTWDARGGEVESTRRMRDEAVAASGRAPRLVRRNDGDVDRALAGAARTLDAVYEVPLLAHAPMEPMSCTAHVRVDSCEIWAPTQNPEDVRDVAARVTGLEPWRITVHVVRMGGAFGRRFYSDFAAEAVAVSKQVGRPVQVVWTREDDVRHDFYRPAGYYHMRAGLDASGALVAWTQHLVNASRGHYLNWPPGDGQRELDPGELEPFDAPAGLVPNVRLGYTPLASRIPRGQWRAVEPSSTVFVSQSFLAEAAQAAGQDPLPYQLALLGAPRTLPFYGGTYDTGRLAAVLRVAAERGRLGERVPPNEGRGIAGSYSNGIYVAHVAHVAVLPDGAVRVKRVATAVDAGRVVNPLGARAQVEGAIVYGLSAALKQEITVESGRVVQRNFDDYPALRIHEAPAMDVTFVPGGPAPRGLGEGALPSIAPAVTNAIFAATGVRVRRLPVGRVTRRA